MIHRSGPPPQGGGSFFAVFDISYPEYSFSVFRTVNSPFIYKIFFIYL